MHSRLPQVAGHKTGFGSPTWLDTHDVASTTAPPVAALLAAGTAHTRNTLSLQQPPGAGMSCLFVPDTTHTSQGMPLAMLPHAPPAPAKHMGSLTVLILTVTGQVAPCCCCLFAGATIVGKTHMSELAYSLDGNNAHYGTPINLAAPGRNTGGSSSGSAVSN